MKKLLLAFVATLLMSCGTTVIDQREYYGVVEDTVFYNGHHHAKVWCSQKGKYYDVITDKLYQIGDTIKIK